MHDVGKIGIPDALLLKPARLTDEEMAVMRTHTAIGAHILGGSEAPLLRLAEVIALSHHERWDGSGLSAITCAARRFRCAGRIVAVADAFDALTNDRPYRQPGPSPTALAEIDAHRGTPVRRARSSTRCDVVPTLARDARLAVQTGLLSICRMNCDSAELRDAS